MPEFIDFENLTDTNISADIEEMLPALVFFRDKYNAVNREDFSWICSFEGSHRKGKSMAAITVGMILDKTFERDMEKRIVYTPEEILNVFSEIAEKNIHGAVVIIDEAGTAMSGSDFYERVQKSINRTIQIFGRWNPIIFLVAPSTDLISSGMRRMFNTQIEMKRFNKDYSIMQIFEVHYSSRRRHYFYPHPTIDILGQKYRLTQINMEKPPQEIIDRYRKFEEGKKKALVADFKTTGLVQEVKQAREISDPQLFVELVVAHPEVYQTQASRPDRIRISEDTISMKFKLPNRLAKGIKHEAERRLNGTKENDISA